MKFPGQIVGFSVVISTTGIGATTTCRLAVDTQLLPSAPTTVYTVVVEGLAITKLPEVVLRPSSGDQVYERAPFATMERESPRHTRAGSGLKVMTGSGLTNKLVVINESQP